MTSQQSCCTRCKTKTIELDRYGKFDKICINCAYDLMVEDGTLQKVMKEHYSKCLK